MLKITRFPGQSIIIDGNIKVTFAQIDGRGKRAHLWIEAPRDVTIHREEIQEKIDAAKRRSDAINKLRPQAEGGE